MRRIELLVVLNGTKLAADRNGGLVIPDRTHEKLASGNAVPWSMGCKVKHDVCQNCYKKSASPKEYCTEHDCINPDTGRRGFGCKTGLTKVADDGMVQYVENPDCTFMDISEVTVPADRTAYGYLCKMAGASDTQNDINAPIGGAALAEHYGWVPREQEQHTSKVARFNHPITSVWESTLFKLADAEYNLREERFYSGDEVQQWGFINSGRKTPERMIAKYANGSHKERAETLMRLADHNIVLTPSQFAKLAAFPVTQNYISCLQNIFGKIAQFPDRHGLYNQMRPYAVGYSSGVYEPAAWFPASAQLTKHGSHQRIIDLATDGIVEPGS